MNFNLIAVLFSACSFLTAAVSNTQSAKIVSAPAVRHNKKDGRTHKQSSHSPSISWKSLSKIDSSLSAAPRSSSSLQLSSEIHESSKICTRRLESILYSPPSNVKDYLNKIANEMRDEIQLIMAEFSAGKMDYIRIFVNRYKILITISAPFGKPVLVAPTFIAAIDPLMIVSLAQTYAGRDGFYVDPSNTYYNYQFSVMSTNGQYISFVLSLPLSAMTNSPTNC